MNTRHLRGILVAASCLAMSTAAGCTKEDVPAPANNSDGNVYVPGEPVTPGTPHEPQMPVDDSVQPER